MAIEQHIVEHVEKSACLLCWLTVHSPSPTLLFSLLRKPALLGCFYITCVWDNLPPHSMQGEDPSPLSLRCGNLAAPMKSAQCSQQVEAPSPRAAAQSLDLQVFTHSPQPPLPQPPFPVVFLINFFFFNVESTNPLARLVPLLSGSIRGILDMKLHRANRSLALPKCLSLPLSLSLGIHPYPLQQGWYLWIVFICWHPGVKALSINCILILSAVCEHFLSSALTS